ncbi:MULTISPECIES: glutathione S-transferase family protein [unclassified Burkholderia]|uniref:glutathione S-transferase family protein n=1 Tax=unclassified Burkholderia TaxID=2613784 RepID=UPI000F57394B|nr:MULTISPECIES: glutathione S-transferase family protein [unclassified Burkholderia]RQR73096.1 glutathione S-transferase family protein [Burkholderia sp. Bp9011]RQR85078.1 glutathione S-transferase family protein [Burkholderia sp. Bp9010]RQR98300.1 glutathione S-transferase family protein [Burkholderia sp. Bp8991]RQS67819.1 glutathione S-transferase family protein [Burkholderia sp. Bp8977]
MSPILLYGIPAGCSFGSIVALEWAGRPYRLSRITMPGLVTSDAFLALNPAAETPAFVTANGDVLTESVAILGHVGAQALDSGLAFRQGSADFDRLNRMLAWLNTTFFSAFGALWYVYEHGAEGAEKAVLQAYGRGKVLKAHRHLEALLERGDGPWLLGAQRTLADAYFAGIARWADYHAVFEQDAFPHVAALRARLADDAGVQFAHAIEENRPLPASSAFEGHVSLDDALASARVTAMPAATL